MSWADLSSMLAELAQQPPFIFVVAMCAFFGGLLIGLYARTPAEEAHSLDKPGRLHTTNSSATRPRVRAGASTSANLKPSYDANKRRARGQ